MEADNRIVGLKKWNLVTIQQDYINPLKFVQILEMHVLAIMSVA